MSDNGWLCPNGKFIPCLIGHNSTIAAGLKPTKRGGYIHIFPSGAFSDLPPTKKQRAWLEKSLETANDETYIDMVRIVLEKK